MDVRKNLIDANELLNAIRDDYNINGAHFAMIRRHIKEATAVDAVEVVRCEKCVLHGNCITEDNFVFVGIENPFCCAGKRKEGAD